MLGSSIEESDNYRESFLHYTQNYVNNLILIAVMPIEHKETRDAAFSLINEKYDEYVTFMHTRLGLDPPAKETIKEKVVDPKLEKMKVLKHISQNVDGSTKQYKSITDLVNSVTSIIKK